MAIELRRRLQVLRRADGYPLAQALWRCMRSPGPGCHGGRRGGHGGGPLGTGPGPGGRPVGQHGGDRPRGRAVQRESGVVPVRRIGSVRSRRRVFRRPVLGVCDMG